MIWVGVIVIATLIVAAWSLSTAHRRDELACDMAKQVLLVDGLSEISADPAEVRALHPYLAQIVQRDGADTTKKPRFGRGSMVVLAKSARDAAEVVATEEGMEVAISCLLGKHRIVELPGGRWAVAVLPRLLGFLGKTCEHGDHPAE